MKETITKISKTKSWFFEMIKEKIFCQTHQEKERRIKSTKLEMKIEKSQHRNTKDHKRLLSATICQ